VGAALLGRIDNNNSREITSLVVAVEPCVQKATNPISKLFIGHSTFFRSPTIVSSSSSSFGCCYTFWVVVVVVVVVIEAGFLLGPCLALVVVTRHTHTHTADVCVCRGGYGTTLTHFLGLFLDDVVVVVVCPRNHGAFFLSSVR
jgi:hypothetical protein